MGRSPRSSVLACTTVWQSGQRCNGKLKGNTVSIMLRGNTIEVRHCSCLSPGILVALLRAGPGFRQSFGAKLDRKSTRLHSSHTAIWYDDFGLKQNLPQPLDI